MIQKLAESTYKAARRVVIAVVGATVLVLGFIMIVTPGPAFVVIPLGLAILSLEFAWAKYWLRRVRESISRTAARAQGLRAEEHRARTSGKE